MRNLIVKIVLCAAFAAPLVAGAITTEELQKQISALMSQITALQQLIGASTATSSTASSTAGAPIFSTFTTIATEAPSTAPIVCPVFNSMLSRGSRGSAVSALQNFLLSRGFTAADAVTGFYGPLTESAVRNFQASQNIISSGDASSTGWGLVGKKTSTAIVRLCAASAADRPTAYTVATSSLSTCLAVPMPTNSCPTGWNPTADSRGCISGYRCTAESICPANYAKINDSCVYVQSSPTTITNCTSYTPTSSQSLASSNPCYYYVPSTSVNSSTQGGNVVESSAFSASPTNGAAPLSVTFPSRQIASPLLADAASHTITFGDGQTQGLTCSSSTLISSSGFCQSSPITHTYTANGTYTASLVQNPRFGPQGASATVVGTVTITVGSTAPVNAALMILSSSRSIENQYLSIANSITSQCTSLAASNAPNVSSSQTALQSIDQLIAGAQSDSVTNQQRALQQLDTMVAQHKMHTAADVISLQQVLNNCGPRLL